MHNLQKNTCKISSISAGFCRATHNASLAAGAIATFTVTNSVITAKDVVLVSIASGTTTDATDVKVQHVAAKDFDVVVRTVTLPRRRRALSSSTMRSFAARRRNGEANGQYNDDGGE